MVEGIVGAIVGGLGALILEIVVMVVGYALFSGFLLKKGPWQRERAANGDRDTKKTRWNKRLASKSSVPRIPSTG